MKDKRFVFGVVLTAMWLGVMVAFMWLMPLPDGLNEWGDFFAGFFSPVAFLWLVVGYLQQGEELRNSNTALKLQADELKASVQQQIEMVRISNQQLLHEKEKYQSEIEERDLATQPIFRFHIKVMPFSNLVEKSQVFMANFGRNVTGLQYVIQCNSENLGSQTFGQFGNGEEHNIVNMKFGETVTISMTYFDGIGRQRVECYELTCSEPGILTTVRI
jgi:hypothetical protein